nr:chitin elicitor receptor kinase 1-like isoform X2 [Quercus suber]
MGRLVMLGMRVVAVVVLGLVVSPSESLTCSSQKFTNKVYANCTDLPYLGAYLHWNYNASIATLSIAFLAEPPQADGWVAWAINPSSTKMPGSQALLAFKPNGSIPTVKTYDISSYNFSSSGTKLSYDVSDLSSWFSDSTIMIFATWRLPEKTEKVNHVWQVGPVSQGVPGPHLLKRDNHLSSGVLQLLPSSGSTSTDQNGTFPPAPAPQTDQNGTFPPLHTGISSGAIAGMSIAAVAGMSIAAVAGASILAFCLYVGVYGRKKKKKEVVETSTLLAVSQHQHVQHRHGITMDKSVEFSYEELAKATDDFSLDNKIGQGGFGSVYYAELRGEKAAIKKMDMQASEEFISELKVLTKVHHLNLESGEKLASDFGIYITIRNFLSNQYLLSVRLIGYCVEGSFFLVYEYIENGNLSQHLHSSGRDPLPWSTRVKIALDSARGLEYIHENTVPVYIHHDIKSANILIDKNFQGKVADFGLTKLTEYGSASLYTRLVGTFGFMAPEYAQFGKISPKIDVYAFGVVLYELISGKEAMFKADEYVPESIGLVALFEDVLSQPDPEEDLHKLVDPRLGDDYPFDSVQKLVQLAKACTQENPQLRPSMRSIVVALMSLSSSTEDWDFGSSYENPAVVHLMSGRGSS